MSAITHVGTVIVPVSDQDAALEFFVSTLGFDKRIDGAFGEGARWIEVAPGDASDVDRARPRPSVRDRRRRGELRHQ